MTFWSERRVMVTGGAGFLGRAVVRQARGGRRCGDQRPAQRRVRPAHSRRRRPTPSPSARPDVVIHLAAVVGGIGANRENPGRFFYDNAVMGLELMEKARQTGVAKFVQIGAMRVPANDDGGKRPDFAFVALIDVFVMWRERFAHPE